MRSVDVHFLYNEREESIPQIVDALDALGYATFYWKRDVQIGENLDVGELQHLEVARKVLVCLGVAGWGPNHLRLFNEAKAKGKEILPILVGSASQKSLTEADGFFLSHRYLDMRQFNNESLERLTQAIGKPLILPSTYRFDLLVNTLVDGNEEQRSGVLDAIESLTISDKNELASRLRVDIQTKFAPGIEQNLASAIRDPNKIPSVRSWMFSAIILAAPEEPENRKLILDHLNPDYDRDQNVRFWILAELFHNNVRYLTTALQIVDKVRSDLVYLLGETILHSKDMGLIESHRKALISKDFEEQWKVLRILRVIAVPELADLVTNLLIETESERTAYDALYALTNPAMMEAALPILHGKLGTADMLDKIMSVLAASDRKTLKIFTGILIHYPDNEIKEALHSALENEATRQIAKSISKTWYLSKGLSSGRRSTVAGYTSDEVDVTHDYIDIKQDVKILTSVMLSIDIKPPLAIGLFGNWGTGKSHFMKAMHAECIELKNKNAFITPKRFHTDIVQIEFNAWNYSDSNLWASLVNHIFEHLSDYATPKVTEKERVNDFLLQIGKLEKEIVQVKSEEEKSRTEREQKEKELQQLQEQRLNKPIEIKELSFATFQGMLSEDDKKALNESLKQMGFPEANKAVVDLATVLNDVNTTKGRLVALVLSIVQSPNGYVTLGFLSVLIIGLPLIGWLLKDEIGAAASVVSTFMIGFATTLTSFNLFLKTALKKVSSGISKIETVKNRIEIVLKSMRDQPTEQENQLTAEIQTIKAQEKAAVENIKTKADLIEIKKLELTEFRKTKSLATFLSERSTAHDYQKHLGLMSVIRKDFESLLNKLAYDTGEGKKISRIILYIDDLDRCPPEKVIEVLQAVHLLLSYNLFVVVVGVDPIWLLKSLKRKYTMNGEGTKTKDQDFLGSSPQHFLEKIFQIPFNLKQMDQTGFSNLIESLMKPKVPATEIAANENDGEQSIEPFIERSEDFNALKPQEIISTTNGSKSVDIAPDSVPALSNGEISTGSQDNIKQREFEVYEESLVIQPWEISFATELNMLIKSPRSAKRFSNLYRLLKAGVEEQNLEDFEGTTQNPGNFQFPMVLLALLVGNVLLSPKNLNSIFRVSNKKVELDETNAQALLDQDQIKSLTEIIGVTTFKADPKLLSDWLPKVCRFSLSMTEDISH